MGSIPTRSTIVFIMNFVEYTHKDYPDLIKERNLGCSTPAAWKPYIEHMLSRIRGLGTDLTILQMKEKFGGLRVYFDGVSDNEGLYPIVEEAGMEVTTVCAVCGSKHNVKYGTRANSGWWLYLCDEHRDMTHPEDEDDTVDA